MIKNLYKEGYTQNRELSWLRFNDRVLQEANQKEVPLLEREKFISIYSSNLKEFFMIRVGSLSQAKQIKLAKIDNKSGMNAAEQLKMIYKAVGKSVNKRDRIYEELKKKLAKVGIIDLQINDCHKEERKYLKEYFRSKIKPLLFPQIVDSYHPFPNLRNGMVVIAAMVSYSNHNAFVFTPLPPSLPALVALPKGKDALVRYVHTEDLIMFYLKDIFKDFNVMEALKIQVLRNEDVNVDDDLFDDIIDYRKKMRKVLNLRQHQSPVALFVSKPMSNEMKKYLFEHLDLEPKQTYLTTYPLDSSFGFELAQLFPEASNYEYEPYVPKLSVNLNYHQKLFPQLLKHDVLLSYPYENMEPLLLLVKEAADDPNVISIKITIYRLAKQARLVEYLCRAAENGKEVITLIELKARFDEQVNIDYSQRLEDAGCTVLYGFSEYKVHSKILLITRNSNHKIQQVAQIATGNFNEKTAKQYTDLAYFTARPGIVKDAEAFFRNMMVGKLDGIYQNLLVAPVSLKSKLIKLIERETNKKTNGKIVIKINSLTDEELIYHLSLASQAGVEIKMIVRGICCLLPGIKGKTENISIRSIVGRYLEHSRIYEFGKGNSEVMYISSADFMTRNTERRVEIACPILDKTIRQRLNNYLDLCLKDTVKSRIISTNGHYERLKDKVEIDSQDLLMRTTKGSKQQLQIKESRHSKVIGVFDTIYQGKEKLKK